MRTVTWERIKHSVKPDGRDKLIRHCLRIYYNKSPTFQSAALLLSFLFHTMRLICDSIVYPTFFWNNISTMNISNGIKSRCLVCPPTKNG